MNESKHKNNTYEGLSPRTRAIARQINRWAHKQVNGSTPPEDENYIHLDWLFRPEYSYVFGGPDRFFSNKAQGFLHIIYDGGIAYDLFSPNGQASCYGLEYEANLYRFVRSLGYDIETTDNICLSLSEVGA